MQNSKFRVSVTTSGLCLHCSTRVAAARLSVVSKLLCEGEHVLVPESSSSLIVATSRGGGVTEEMGEGIRDR